MIKEFSIEGVRKYRVRDESTGFVIHSTYGKHTINHRMDTYDAREIVKNVCREMGIEGWHCVHMIGAKIYFDAIVEK